MTLIDLLWYTCCCSTYGRIWNSHDPAAMVLYAGGLPLTVDPGAALYGTWFHPALGNRSSASWQACSPIPICFRLFWHLDRAAASRTFWTAGSSRPMRMAMMAITTSSSISVNADRGRRARKEDIPDPPGREKRMRGTAAAGRGAPRPGPDRARRFGPTGREVGIRQ